jgi:nucleotide-binding universal stress UspA family protein
MNDWKNVLITVDDTPTSDRGLEYAGHILARLDGLRICLLHIFPEPPPDYYTRGGSLDDYRKEQIARAEGLLTRAEELLAGFGINRSDMTRDIRMAEHATISESIMAVQEEGKFGTIVVGKRGVSKAEEFLFGSISNALVHHTRDCTVWVVG